MKDISLKDLLEAGCHFGHKVERWHPKANEFIYTEREGLHIIDLVKTRDGLKKAAEFLRDLAKSGKSTLFVATKRQAKGVATDAAQRAGIPYLTNRWIGGFITNWEQVVKNINKLNIMRKEKEDGSWSKFPKHEIVQLEKDLRKKEAVYAGVANLVRLTDAIFIVDIKKEVSALREAQKYGLPIVAIVDTNTDPNQVDYAIPSNDDAVGSIKYIVDYLSDAYIEGKNVALRQAQGKEEKKEGKEKVEQVEKVGQVGQVEKVETKASKEQRVKEEKEESQPKADQPRAEKKKPFDKSQGKRGRPKKSSSPN